MLQQPEAVTPDFAEQVDDILAMLGGTYAVDDFDVHVVPGARHATSAVGVRQQQGSERAGGGCARAAVRGQLPHHPGHRARGDRGVPQRLSAVGASWREPYVVVSADVVVADDTATARHLASSYGHWVYSIRAAGGAAPYPDPDDCDAADRRSSSTS